MAQRKRVLARREVPKVKILKRKERKEKRKKRDDYSKDNQCLDCGKPITNRAKRCKGCHLECMIEQQITKRQGSITRWRKALLGDAELPGPNDPITPCEICDTEPRAPDTWWCIPCQEAVDAEYLERAAA